MNITLLPVEIKINVLEYAGSHILLKVRDEDIINRIKIYDLSFDYNKWKEMINTKREYIDHVMKSPLLDMCRYMLDNNIRIDTFIEATISLSIAGFMEMPNEILDYIDTFADRYAVTYAHTFGNEVYIRCINEDKAEELFDEFIVVRTYICPRSNTIDTTNIDQEISTLHIPYSLSGYLRYSIDRKRTYTHISNHPLYSVYKILEAYEWTFEGNSGYYTIRIRNISNGELDILLKEMYKVINSGMISSFPVNDGICISITSDNINYLSDIHRYYYPFVPIIYL